MDTTSLDGNTSLETAPLDTKRRLEELLRAARPAHWIKNLACFAGLIFSGLLFQADAIARACLAFSGFCLAASSVYLFNDLIDRARDLRNPLKKGRPIASGRVTPEWAVSCAGVLGVGALGSSLALPRLCTWVLIVYLAMSAAYSVRLKHVVLLDVAIIALGFVLRVLYGVYAVGVSPTSWVVLCMFFLALFLGFAKRRGELGQAALDASLSRPVLAKYQSGFLDLLLAMTAAMAILCYALYTVTGHQGNATLVVTVPLVTYGVTRYMLLVMIRGEGEEPERLLVTDWVLVVTAALWIVLCVAIIYSKVHVFSE